MTDIWGNLWRPFYLVNYEDNFEMVVETDLLKKIKAEGDKLKDQLEAVNIAFEIHYSTLQDCAWMDSKKMLKALDETAEKVKESLVQSSEKTEDEPK